MRMTHLKSLSKDCRGVVTIEMALVAVSVFAFAPLIMDLATVITSSVSLGGGLRAGMQFALNQPTNTSGITQTVQTASGLGNSVAVTTSEACDCAGSSATCGSTCPLGGPPAAYVTISANYSVPTLLPYSGYPQTSFPISNTVTVRVQ